MTSCRSAALRTPRSKRRGAAELPLDARCRDRIERTVVGRPLEEQQLVLRARDGDVGAYERIVEEYQHIAFRAAYLMTRNHEDAEEAVQEGFVKAFAALDRFRVGAPLRPWLIKIVINEARNRRRGTGRRARLELRAVEGFKVSGAYSASAEAQVLVMDERAALLDAVESLADRDRAVVTCRYLLDMSERETAEALGWRLGTVKSRLSRALERLRRELEATA
jgi:RNA polymerase sigma factor (sigma-70 family)